MPIIPALIIQVNLIPSVRHTTLDQTFTSRTRPRQDKVTDILDARRPESIRLGVRRDVLLEDEVLRVGEGVGGPVLGFDFEVRIAS
jgi:hypothetical protein